MPSDLLALGYLGLVKRGESLLRSVVKTGAVVLLALAAVVADAPGLLVLALCFCALGDWCLSRPGQRAFMAGIAAFAVGHLAYIALFLSHSAADFGRLVQFPNILIILGFILLGAVMVRLLAPRAADLRGPVLGYIPIILGMGVAVLVVDPVGVLALALPAALLFIFSDLVLAFETFLLAQDHTARRVTPWVIWVTYWGAQMLFLLAFG